MTLAENLGERGDQPPPPPPVPPQDRLTPQIPDALKREYQETETAERAVTPDASSPSLMQKVYLTLAALIMVLTSHADDETPSPEPNQATPEYVAPAKYHVSHGDLAVRILGETGKVVSAIGEDAKDKADALDDAARLAADRNQNVPGIEMEFRREDLDRTQDEDK
jgi:hypothetical protein